MAAVVEHIAEERKAPAQAIRTRAVISKVFSFALKSPIAQVRFRVIANPVLATEPPADPPERDRVLTPSEIRAVWAAVAKEPAPVAAIFKLYLLTAQRGGELRTMRREDVDTETGWWTIPAERAKKGKSHRVALSPPALALALVVEQMARVPVTTHWLFPAEKATNKKPYRASIHEAAERVQELTGTDFRPRDLRRTAASNMAAMGVPRLTISKILNHAETGITRVY